MPRASLGLPAPLTVFALLALALTLLGGLLPVAQAQSPAVPLPSALEPASTGGVAVADRALAKLSTHARLLVIGAHPDDEDTSLLTLVSRGLGGEAAYLALSRGDGGQNLIGSELGEGLGLIRTQELLAARRVDGSHQYFTRAFDFGYTRSLDETLTRWPRESLMEDVARVVWRFRPQVVVAMFSPEVGGHGQHLASGWAAQEVFAAMQDGETLAPGVRGRLLEEGWSPWRPEVLYRRTWFDPERATFEVPIGQVDALSGKSVSQVAMWSRSQHRSQDMGMLQPLGERRAGLEWVAGGVGLEATGLFDGIDTALSAIASGLPPGELRVVTEEALREVGAAAQQAREGLSAARLSASVPIFATILRTLHNLHDLLTADGSGEAAVIAELVAEKIEIAEAGLAAAASIGLEAVSDRESVAPGGVSQIVASVWDAGDQEAEVLNVEVVSSPAWSFERASGAEPDGKSDGKPDGELDGQGIRKWTFSARVSESAEPSVAYFSRSPRRGDLYDWDGVPAALRGLPYQPPELSARFELSIGGQRVQLMREVVFRTRDQAVGEVRRPIRIVPRVEVSVAPGTLLWDVRDGRPRPVRVTVRSHLDRAVSGRLEAVCPAGWSASESSFEIAEPGGEVTIEVAIQPRAKSASTGASSTGVPTNGAPSNGALSAGRHEISFRAVLEDGGHDEVSVPLLEYPHIRPTPRLSPAVLEISAFELDLPDVGPIGYVRGASDLVPEFLGLVGMEVELLDAEALSRGDLDRFRVIVIGSRAYETDPALAAANSRLLDFARAGGRLVVQYQQYQFVRGGFVPFEFEIARPHDRITDEMAPVDLLEPEHPVLNRPNQLTDADWEGWVQERGLYFAHTWGDEFLPLLSIADPEMDAQRGGLLIAPLGEGVYVYTGLAFFRQLPAGVAGGYRLLANLLAIE